MMTKTTIQDPKETLAALTLMAATADGEIADCERIKVRDQMGELDVESMGRIYQTVLTKQTPVEVVLEKIRAFSLHREAYDLAVSICKSDGVIKQTEKKFLSRLRSYLEGKPLQMFSLVALGFPLMVADEEFRILDRRSDWGHAMSAVTGGHPEDINGM